MGLVKASVVADTSAMEYLSVLGWYHWLVSGWLVVER